jgi:hypothetical protein
MCVVDSRLLATADPVPQPLRRISQRHQSAPVEPKSSVRKIRPLFVLTVSKSLRSHLLAMPLIF